ncbi:hypothetical protein VULLAG_LOCUS14141 [Vulpes lagopus]
MKSQLNVEDLKTPQHTAYYSGACRVLRGFTARAGRSRSDRSGFPDEDVTAANSDACATPKQGSFPGTVGSCQTTPGLACTTSHEVTVAQSQNDEQGSFPGAGAQPPRRRGLPGRPPPVT